MMKPTLCLTKIALLCLMLCSSLDAMAAKHRKKPHKKSPKATKVVKAPAQKWIRLSETENAVTYIDPATLIRQNDTATLWALFDMKEVQVSGNGRGYASRKVRVEYNCTQEKFRMTECAFYSARQAQGQRVDQCDVPMITPPPVIPSPQIEKPVTQKLTKKKRKELWVAKKTIQTPPPPLVIINPLITTPFERVLPDTFSEHSFNVACRPAILPVTSGKIPSLNNNSLITPEMISTSKVTPLPAAAGRGSIPPAIITPPPTAATSKALQPEALLPLSPQSKTPATAVESHKQAETEVISPSSPKP